MTRLWRRRKDDIPGRSLTSVGPPSPDEAGRHSAFLEHAQEAMILVEGGAVHWLNPAATLMFPGLAEPVGGRYSRSLGITGSRRWRNGPSNRGSSRRRQSSCPDWAGGS